MVVKGETFDEWRSQLEALGYAVEFRELRASDYGAPTIRKRLFIVARRDGQPIRWPAPTHGKGGFAFLPYRTAAECIDWSLPCPSIFDRKKPLADATLRRIAAGIRRYVIEAEQPFLVTITHNQGGDGMITGAGEPLRTITTSKGGEQALVTPYLASLTHHGSDRVEGLGEPFLTITGAHRGEKALITPTLVQTGYGERTGQAPRALDIEAPLGTIVAGAVKHALIAPTIVRMNHDGQGKPADSVDDPLATVTTQHNKHQLVTAFLAKHFGGHETPGAALGDAMSTVTARDHHALVSSHLVKLYGTAEHGAPLTDPMPTVTSTGTHIGEVRAFLLKYYGNDREGQGLATPLHTVTAKERFALGIVHVAGEPYQIVDIGMRMLTARELFRAQGFPDGYVIDPLIDGKRLTKTAQIRMCGNSVCPPAARAIVAANVGPLGQQHLWRGHEVVTAEAAS